MNGFRLEARFFRTTTGTEPVRDWLKSLEQADRKTIGEDIKTVQFGWPMGMPLVRKLETNLWEVRSNLKDRISRVVFTVHDNTMILPHGFIKKAQKTPATDLNTARKRLAELKERDS
jgi:phage-related protein